MALCSGKEQHRDPRSNAQSRIALVQLRRRRGSFRPGFLQTSDVSFVVGAEHQGECSTEYVQNGSRGIGRNAICQARQFGEVETVPEVGRDYSLGYGSRWVVSSSRSSHHTTNTLFQQADSEIECRVWKTITHGQVPLRERCRHTGS